MGSDRESATPQARGVDREGQDTHFIHNLDDETGILFIHFKDEILEGGIAQPLENLIKIQENLNNLEK